jgi:predicted RNase H-like HicB family nuclease
MKTHYSIIIQWSDVDSCYIASLPEFGPYALTHGETYEDALRNGQEVLELLMESTSPLPPPHTFKESNTQIHA